MTERATLIPVSTLSRRAVRRSRIRSCLIALREDRTSQRNPSSLSTRKKGHDESNISRENWYEQQSGFRNVVSCNAQYRAISGAWNFLARVKLAPYCWFCEQTPFCRFCMKRPFVGWYLACFSLVFSFFFCFVNPVLAITSSESAPTSSMMH